MHFLRRYFIAGNRDYVRPERWQDTLFLLFKMRKEHDKAGQKANQDKMERQISTTKMKPQQTLVLIKPDGLVKSLTGNIITDDILIPNWDVYLANMQKLGSQGEGMIGFDVKSWPSNTVVLLQIRGANGEEYETQVDVVTGKVLESTFKRIK